MLDFGIFPRFSNSDTGFPGTLHVHPLYVRFECKCFVRVEGKSLSVHTCYRQGYRTGYCQFRWRNARFLSKAEGKPDWHVCLKRKWNANERIIMRRNEERKKKNMEEEVWYEWKFSVGNVSRLPESGLQRRMAGESPLVKNPDFSYRAIECARKHVNKPFRRERKPARDTYSRVSSWFSRRENGCTAVERISQKERALLSIWNQFYGRTASCAL